MYAKRSRTLRIILHTQWNSRLKLQKNGKLIVKCESNVYGRLLYIRAFAIYNCNQTE